MNKIPSVIAIFYVDSHNNACEAIYGVGCDKGEILYLLNIASQDMPNTLNIKTNEVNEVGLSYCFLTRDLSDRGVFINIELRNKLQKEEIYSLIIAKLIKEL